MMSVSEYAEDMDLTVEEVLKFCKKIGIEIVNSKTILTEKQIIELDNLLAQSSDFLEKDIVVYKENMTVQDLAIGIGVSGSDIVKKLFELGIIVNINANIDFDTAEVIVNEYQMVLKKEEVLDISNFEEYEMTDLEEDLLLRPPVVTIMGHVDHGKTTLLDTIRKTKVASGEAGGITQVISAYQAKCHGQLITFIDTPGHAAFTQMRARGASITDIVIIIVAADDGVMPQTKEAIDHAKAANVPIIVAINKVDKPNTNIEKIKTDLTECGLMPEEWGGDILYNNISALTGEGIDELLENILLIASLNEYKANPNRLASGTVIETSLDKKTGIIATLLIQNGTLKLGDPLVIGSCFGKVRTLKNDLNEDIKEALPSEPVYITGLSELPIAGDKFMAFKTEKEAKGVASIRKSRNVLASTKKQAVNLDDLFSKIQDGTKELNLIIKADSNGSSEALKATIEQIKIEDIIVNIIRSGVGAITENDIVLAQASKAIIIGFNVRPSNYVRDIANNSNVEIRLYDVIYNVVEDIEKALKGMLEPTYEEKIIGSAEVRQLFKFSKVGTIAGSYVLDGYIKTKSKARVIRNGIVIYDGDIQSIQREKDSVREVKKGLECGITIEKYNDIKVGDIIESYEIIEKKVI